MVCCLSAFLGHAQTTLNLGDIAMTGYQSDNPDTYSFVLLTDIVPTTTITFTDNGWFAAGGFRAGEGTTTYTANDNMSCGTQITISGTTASNDGGYLVGTVSGSLSLSNSGDQIFVYQGTAPTGADMSNFITAMQMNGAWDADATGSNTSAQPTVFTDGVNSISISPEVDNAVYDCSTIGPDAATIRSAVTNSSNWTVSGSLGLTIAPACAFNCGAVCTLDTEPTTNASGITISNVGCNGMTISWTSGNGSDRIVVMRAGSAVSGTPTDQTTYTGNSEFGSGATIAAGEFVVYNGSGDSVNVYGLAASTTYHIAIFEYNGIVCEENYLTTGAPTNNQATTVCNNCPQMTSLLINSCQGACGEGDNEMVFLHTGDYMVPVSPSDFVFLYGPTNPPTPNFTQSLASTPAVITDMNNAAGCTAFVDASDKGYIPPNTDFILVSSTTCMNGNQDLSALCANAPIYVVVTTDATWSTSGNFNNSTSCSGGQRFIRTDFTNFAAGCLTDYNWTCANVTGTDGDYAVWPNGGGAATVYGDDDCAPSTAILPIELLYFTARPVGSTVRLEWSTASETNNDIFTVLRSADGYSFSPIGTLQGAGTSIVQQSYELVDEDPYYGTSYYRLMQTDLDGTITFSEIIAVNFGNAGNLQIDQVTDQGDIVEVLVSSEDHLPVTLTVHDVAGRLIYEQTREAGAPGVFFIPASYLSKGMFILRASDGIAIDHMKFSYAAPR